MFAPFKDVRKHDANLVTWLMKKYNLKGRKIKSLLNRYDNIDLNGVVQLYHFLGHITILLRFWFNQADHQLKELFAIILCLQLDIKNRSSKLSLVQSTYLIKK